LLLGVLLALTCAALTNASFLLRQRGAVESPRVDVRHPLRSVRFLFGSRWWTIGWLAAVVAWCLHVGALAAMPLSFVQAIIAGGLVFLAVLGERFFGMHLGRRQWTGLAVTAAGLVILGLTEGAGGPGARASLGALIAVEGAVAVLSATLVGISITLPRLHPAEGMVLGAAAGTLFGIADISIKYLTHVAHAGLGGAILNGWIAAALAAAVVAFYASARSLQLGPAFEVIAFTSVSANLIAISGGILVFHDSVGHGALQITGRMIAFVLVIAGAGLMPAHHRRDHRASQPPPLAAGRRRSHAPTTSQTASPSHG
jgi:drug/metabolite transporter (DMT)-like permease